VYEHSRIKQVLPADGWRVVYAVEPGHVEPEAVAVWMVIEQWKCAHFNCPLVVGQECDRAIAHKQFESSVVPGVCDHDGGYIYPVVEDGNLVYLLGPEQALRDASRAVEQYEKRQELKRVQA
jgi:hypothetical protein